MSRRSASSFDWMGWFRGNLLALLGITTAVIGFAYTQIKTIDEIKYTVANQREQFVSMQKTFEQFDKTQKSNYEDYAKNQKIEAEKSAKALELLNLSAVRTGTQVEGLGKGLDEVKAELKAITTRQQENRQIFQQGGKR